MNCVKIRKSGTFYNVLDDDCYILYYLFGYNIKNYKVGFPKSALNKVINKLDECKINYLVFILNKDKLVTYNNDLKIYNMLESEFFQKVLII